MTSTDVNLQFGRNLTALRKNAGLTRKKLAEILNVTEMAVGTYERGIRTPSLDKILQLADLFKVSTDDLLKNNNAEIANNLLEGCVKCVFKVGNRETEFDIPVADAKYYVLMQNSITEILNAVKFASEELLKTNAPVQLSFTLRTIDAKEE